MKRVSVAWCMCVLVVLSACCQGRSGPEPPVGPKVARGPLPDSFRVQVTGVGRSSDSAASPGQARLMAEAAAEADAQRRLVLALYGDSSGKLTDVRRVSTTYLEGGWCLVTVEMNLPTLQDYVIVLDRLSRMAPAVMKAVKTQAPPKAVETVVPPQ